MGVGIFKETYEQNKESVCTRPLAPWAKLNFALVAICCAIISPQSAKMGPKIASQNELCSLLSFPKKEREKANTIGELKSNTIPGSASVLYLMEDSVECYNIYDTRYGAL